MKLKSKFFVFNKCLSHKLFKIRTPLLVSLSVTGRCNLRCPYCYINVYNRDPVEMSFEELCKVIDEFYNLGTRIFFLQGGEPMVRKDIVDIVRYIKDKDCYCSISTNGTISKYIASLGNLVDHLEISLDGPSEVNDKSRGKGVYDKVVRAARMAMENRIKFHFHTVLNMYNFDVENIKHVADLAKEYKAYVTACFATPSGYENNREFISQVSFDKVKEGYRALIRLKKEGYVIGNSLNALNHALNWPISHTEVGFKSNLPASYDWQCLHGRLTAWLDHEGWLYPCTRAFGREDFRENIHESGVREAWAKLSRLDCVDCGTSSDLTYLFSLRLENLLKIKKY